MGQSDGVVSAERSELDSPLFSIATVVGIAAALFTVAVESQHVFDTLPEAKTIVIEQPAVRLAAGPTHELQRPDLACDVMAPGTPN